MAKTKLTSRQKLINMMYIVLTALLALNVSKQVLKSFHLMEQGFISTSEQLDSKNSAIMRAFETGAKTDAQKTKPYLERAVQARAISAEFCSYIDSMKKEIETLGGGRKSLEEGDLIGEIKKADAMEKHANYFLNEGKGPELQQKINETRKKLLALLKPEGEINLDEFHFAHLSNTSQLRADDPEFESGKGERKTWVSVYLEENPMAGVLAMLTKIKNDAKNLETDVLTKLYDGIYFGDIPINRIEAKVIPKSNYVMSGTPYEAEILLVASNSTSENKILVNGAEIEVDSGRGIYKELHHSPGQKTFKGSIMVKGKDGKEQPYNFDAKYNVYSPLATISAEKMNVLYGGLKNPIAIAVPGFPASAVRATISNGWRLRSNGNGKYIAEGRANTREATVTVSVVTENGTKVMGTQKYRIKRVPKPKFKVGNLDPSKPVSPGQLCASSRVFASLGSGFVFDGINYSTVKFKMQLYSKRNGLKPLTVRGNNFSKYCSEIRRLRSGDMVFFTDIEVRGPNGLEKIDGIPFTIR